MAPISDPYQPPPPPTAADDVPFSGQSRKCQPHHLLVLCISILFLIFITFLSYKAVQVDFPNFEIESVSISLKEFNASEEEEQLSFPTVWELGFTVEKQNDKIGDFGVWVRCAKSPDWSGREMGTFGLRENGNARVNVTLSTMLFDCGPVEMKALEYDVMFKGRYLDYEFKAVCKNMTAAEAHGGRGGSFMVGPPKSCRVNDYKRLR